MGSIGIRIGHDNYFVIIAIFNLKLGAYSSANGVNDRVDFFVFTMSCSLAFPCSKPYHEAAGLLGIYGYGLA
jgi:hypothetical protein